jgi:hypothetical protein
VRPFWITGGCADGSVEQNFGDGMVGCAATQSFANRAALCGPGFRATSAAEWVALRSGLAPVHDYWTRDALRTSGNASSSCFASATVGTDCGASPARVCTAAGTDAEGNTCSLTHCGLDTATPDQFLGGCTANPSAGALCIASAGCADGSAEQVFANGVVGCAGAVTFPNRGTLCAAGYRPLTSHEWLMTMGSSVPEHHYWTDDPLKFTGTGSGACSVSLSRGTDCGANTPMRVCATTSVDPEGNVCNWTHCTMQEYTSSDFYFGGCSSATAGTLCIPSDTPPWYAANAR